MVLVGQQASTEPPAGATTQRHVHSWPAVATPDHKMPVGLQHPELVSLVLGVLQDSLSGLQQDANLSFGLRGVF
jgi:hypothetical protein